MGQNKPENLKCPQCSGEMTPRNGPHGKFWGCKRFPECSGTRDSMGRSRDERFAENDDQTESVGESSKSRWRFSKN